MAGMVMHGRQQRVLRGGQLLLVLHGWQQRALHGGQLLLLLHGGYQRALHGGQLLGHPTASFTPAEAGAHRKALGTEDLRFSWSMKNEQLIYTLPRMSTVSEQGAPPDHSYQPPDRAPDSPRASASALPSSKAGYLSTPRNSAPLAGAISACFRAKPRKWRTARRDHGQGVGRGAICGMR